MTCWKVQVSESQRFLGQLATEIVPEICTPKTRGGGGLQGASGRTHKGSNEALKNTCKGFKRTV